MIKQEIIANISEGYAQAFERGRGELNYPALSGWLMALIKRELKITDADWKDAEKRGWLLYGIKAIGDAGKEGKST